MKMKKWSRGAAAASMAMVFAVGMLFATSAQAAGGDGSATTDSRYTIPDTVDWEEERELYKSFEKFGISYDDDGKMYYNGERVRWFWDGYEIWEDDGTLLGWSIRYEYLDKEGTVDVRTLHAREDNGDGSWNGYGPLIDIVPYSQEEFDARTYGELKREREETVAVASDDSVLVQEPAYPGTQDVTDAVAFAEETGVVASSGDEAELPASAVEGAAEATYVVSDGSAERAEGRTFAEIFAQYEPYGITYREGNGTREVFYNGELAAQFIDLQPGGGVFSFTSISDKLSTLTVRTAYDKNGKLTGVAPSGQSAAYASYERFGLTTGSDGKLYYNGELVRRFDDSVPKAGGGTTAVGYLNKAGTVDVRAVRDKKQALTRLERASVAESDTRETRIAVEAGTAESGDDSMEMFSPYTAFGLTIKNDSLYYNGERVRCFWDEQKRRMVSNWDSLGTVDVYAVRESGKLAGLRTATKEEYEANTVVADGQIEQYEYAH